MEAISITKTSNRNHILTNIIGDDKQLPPVEDEGVEDYFNRPAVHYLTNSNRNILTVQNCFDDKLYQYLKNVDELDTSTFDVKETKRNLCYYNKKRKYIHKNWNDKLKTVDSVLIKEDVNDEYTQDVYICKDLPVIARNWFKKEIYV